MSAARDGVLARVYVLVRLVLHQVQLDRIEMLVSPMVPVCTPGEMHDGSHFNLSRMMDSSSHKIGNR
jgi:hypothetical protein